MEADNYMRAFLSFVGFIAATILPAAGGSAVYSTLSDWTASSPGTGLGVLDFEAATVSYTSVFAYNPFTITAGSGGEWLLTNAAAGTGSGHYLTTDLSPAMNIALSSGVYGVAFNLGSNSASPAIASIVATDVNGVQYTTSGFSTSGPAGPAAFWGLRTSVQLVSVHILFVAVLPQVDNLRYSNIALPPPDPSIPEPGTWVLVLSGLVALWRPAVLRSRLRRTIAHPLLNICGESQCNPTSATSLQSRDRKGAGLPREPTSKSARSLTRSA